MTTTKVAVTIDSALLAQIDQLVARQIFPNRSKAVQIALQATIARVQRTRLARESAKLLPADEQALADEGLAEELTTWPAY